jgi:methionyl-tRNA synthetase
VPGKFYVTTPIYYVNDAPHIGHAYPTVTADALARWHRLVGDDTFFLTGTDEHGLKVQRSAEANGITPQEQADRTSARYRETWDLLGVQPDDFIRTTEPRHHQSVQALLTKAKDNGYIVKDTYAGWYCVSCEAYYGNDELLPPAEGTDGPPLCAIHKRPVEWLEEDNWFFKLSEFEQRLLDWIDADPDAIQPVGKRSEALGLIRQGLKDISISRSSISWGVTVPWDERHVFYVWYDALINYATAIGYGTDPERFAEWWPHVHHLLGKDILRFHCVYWPALLLAAGELPPHRLYVHGFLLIGGEKMSKTSLNQISPADLVADFGVDGFRHHLLADLPYGPDGEFSYEGMVARYNADLANNLGNLLSRVATVVAKKCGGIGPAPRQDSPLAAVAVAAVADTEAGWASVAPPQALEATWRLIRASNALLEEEEPWKSDPGPQVEGVLGDAIEALRIVSILASPALPTATAELWRRLGLPGRPDEQPYPAAVSWGGYPGGLPVEKGAPLFPRMSP